MSALDKTNCKPLNNRISFPVGLRTEWVSPDTLAIPDPYLKNWLLDTGSLTERLQSHCRHFELHLIGQDNAEVTDEELRLLTGENTQRDGKWQVREVILKGEGAPWVFARSVLPDALCDQDFSGLGNKPLGQIIFNDARFVREPFQVTLLDTAESLLTHLGMPIAKQLWGRRSVFSYQNYRMSVAEVFLPSAPAYKQIPNLVHE